MNFVFHPEAEVELNEAVDYYNTCRPDLGWEFIGVVYSALRNILVYLQAWTPLSPRTRRCLVHRFPYGVVYQVINDGILIVAIMQLNRKPGYWRDRIR